MIKIIYQSVFCLKIHQNNIFFIFLNLFSLIRQNNLKVLKINLNKKIKILKNKLDHAIKHPSKTEQHYVHVIL
jgi:hypothetical protein